MLEHALPYLAFASVTATRISSFLVAWPQPGAQGIQLGVKQRGCNGLSTPSNSSSSSATLLCPAVTLSACAAQLARCLTLSSRRQRLAAYTMGYCVEKQKFMEEVEEHGVKVFIEPKALMFLIGTEMDFVDDRLRSEFVFHNPNSKGECGCGESFNV